MKKRKIRHTLCILLGIVCIAFIGCAQKKEKEEKSAEVASAQEVSYKASIKSGILSSKKQTYNFAKTRSGLYTAYDVGGQVKLLCFEKAELWQPGNSLSYGDGILEVPEGQFMLSFFAGYEDSLFSINQIMTEQSVQYFLCGYSEEGTLSRQVEITEVLLGAGEGDMFSVFKVAVDEEGRIYLQLSGNRNNLLVLSKDAELICTINTEGMLLTSLTTIGDTAYGIGQSGGLDSIYKIDVEMQALEEIISIPEGRGNTKIVGSKDGLIWYSDFVGVKTYSISNKETKNIYEWADIGIAGNDVSFVFLEGEDRFGAALKRIGDEIELRLSLVREGVQGTSENGQEESTKQKIILADAKWNTMLMKAIAGFNASNDIYEVVIEEYGSQERILTEIMVGKGPDILRLYDVGMSRGVACGIIEDLNPYLEQSQALSPELLNSKVLELYTYDGVLTSIPAGVSIDTMYGKASELGNEEGWTIEEFKAYVEKHRGATIFEGRTVGDTQMVLVYMFVWTQPDKWMDLKEKKAYFDSEEFLEIMKFAAEYEAKYDADASTTVSKLRDGRVLLYTFGPSNPWSYVDTIGIFEGDLVAIGQPTENGEPRHGISASGSAYIINSSSKNKEGAWAFIEYLILHEGEGRMWSFPTYLPNFEKVMKEELEVKEFSYQDSDGNTIFRRTLNQEDIEILRNMIDSSSYVTEPSPVDSILYEEMDTCFNGNRSPEETVKIIQNRVQLYLSEMD